MLQSMGLWAPVVFIALMFVLIALTFALTRPLLSVSRAIDTFNTGFGRVVAWAILVAVLVSAANAIIRKVFDTSSNAWLELQWVLFGAVFLVCASWTLLSNEHIRIDIVSSLLSKRARNWIDIIGHALFTIPIAIVMIYTTYPFFMRSLAQNEQSTNAGGLPLYPAKFLVLLGFVLLLFQGFSELIKRVAITRGMMEDTTSGGGHHAAAEAEAERLRQVALEEAAELERARAAKG
jgi:TRAP-type mannitol/chloroaromatic compound transport system permease small subunit